MDKIFIVMDYVEHDLKSLMETMKQPFLEGEACRCSTCTVAFFRRDKDIADSAFKSRASSP